MKNPNENLIIISTPENPAMKLINHAGNFLSIVSSAFNLATKDKLPYNKETLQKSANNHTEDIRSLYAEIDEEKAQILEDFCLFALQVPDEIDEQYLETLRQKYENVKKVAESL